MHDASPFVSSLSTGELPSAFTTSIQVNLDGRSRSTRMMRPRTRSIAFIRSEPAKYGPRCKSDEHGLERDSRGKHGRIEEEGRECQPEPLAVALKLVSQWWATGGTTRRT